MIMRQIPIRLDYKTLLPIAFALFFLFKKRFDSRCLYPFLICLQRKAVLKVHQLFGAVFAAESK